MKGENTIGQYGRKKIFINYRTFGNIGAHPADLIIHH